jgi:hypothetical protein
MAGRPGTWNQILAKSEASGSNGVRGGKSATLGLGVSWYRNREKFGAKEEQEMDLGGTVT